MNKFSGNFERSDHKTTTTMNKQAYQKPALRVVKIQQTSIICTSNSVSSVNSNADLNYGGGGSGPARARSHGGIDWDDEW